MSDIGTIDACIKPPPPANNLFHAHLFTTYPFRYFRTRIHVLEGVIQNAYWLDSGYL